jgi:hypothetical protein
MGPLKVWFGTYVGGQEAQGKHFGQYCWQSAQKKPLWPLGGHKVTKTSWNDRHVVVDGIDGLRQETQGA